MRLVLALALLMMSCSSDTRPATDGSSSGAETTAGTGETTGGDTAGATGNATGGDTADGGTTGQPTPLCESHDDCDGQDICDCLGSCVAPGLPDLSCTEDKNCGSGNYCDTCAGACREKVGICDACTDTNGRECKDDGACVDFATGGRFCLRACVADVGCPQPGYTCKEVPGAEFKQCVPLGDCAKAVLCEADSECDYGWVCGADGVCHPGCPSDDVCPDGQVCSVFHCVDQCPDKPCPAGQECDDSGHCKIPGGCLEPKDCETPETYCDVTENMCKDGCLEDFDCKSSGKVCDGGKCIDAGCTANFFCAFGEVCNLASGACEPAPGPHCEMGCDPQAETSCGGAPPNACLSLQDKDGNALGDFCFVACETDPANRCPQGYQCQEVELGEGDVRQLCFRDCTYDPLAP